ncbi:AMP-binding protein [Nostocaceae cyanobacterium CENA369]|uniref:AMP-binding protein n=1 Tax=Dendronalium phyllosphericum CENA369 TaxID=1725256 RepID=A0A8J7I700_9NOST|nr:AMP-binding protein [Dendronalium phyllosphericum]MBH8577275.1 AMP-binding protein [Dendronalium phyllosphericum CENA369]
MKLPEVARMPELQLPVQESLTMLDMIHALEDTDAHIGLFLQEDRKDTKFLPYCNFKKQITAYMAYFRSQGVTVGTRIVFPFETTESVLISFFALIGLGAIPLSIKPYGIGVLKDSYLAFINRIADSYNARLILEAPSIKSLDFSHQRLPLPSTDFQPQTSPNFAAITSGDIAFVQFSSGSTAFPKGIPVTHGKIMAQIQIIANYAQSRQGDEAASWLPLYHDMGLVGGFLTTLYRRLNLHLSTPVKFLINPIGWLSELSKKRIAIAVIPDFAISYCLRRLENSETAEIADLNLENLRIVFNGSEPINIKNLYKFIEMLAPYGLRPTAIKPCYGMAEAVLMVSCCQLEDVPKVLTLANGCQAISSGKPLSDFSVRLISEDGTVCRESEIGEIQIRGGSLVDGYWENAHLFDNSDGFFSTGDLGVMSEGELFITGRISDRFKINGQSYFATDFEHCLESLPFVQSGKVAAIQADENIIILIETKQTSVLKGATEYKQQTSEIILNHIGVKVPVEQIFFIRPGLLEKTSSGKLQRKRIAEAYMRGKITPAVLC